MDRTIRRRTDTTRRVRPGWIAVLALLCSVIFTACAGGSGSSGFDAALKAENEAIDRALASGDCELHDGLMICASQGSPIPPAVTATATASPRRTPTASLTAGPIDTTPSPTIPTTPTTTQAAPTLTPTPTAIPAGPGVETNVDEATDTFPCQEATDGGPCVFVFHFQPVGAPSGAAYRVAVRTQNPSSSWRIETPVDNSVLIAVEPGGPDYQLAVLLYLADPAFVPDHVDLLADSGADFAFVTPVLTPETLLTH